MSDQQKLNRMATSLTNLQCYKAECMDFLSCIIIRGRNILNHRWRRNSWCWKIPLAGTEVVHENCEHGADTMFWDSHRLILVNCMLHGVTVMAVALQLVLQCLTEAFHHQRPGLLTWYILLLHYTTNTLLDMWCWECVPHPQQSPDCGFLGCSCFWKTGEKKLCRLVISICQQSKHIFSGLLCVTVKLKVTLTQCFTFCKTCLWIKLHIFKLNACMTFHHTWFMSHPTPLILFDFIVPVLGEEYRSWSSSLCSFLTCY
jgi:hypothetical protein